MHHPAHAVGALHAEEKVGIVPEAELGSATAVKALSVVQSFLAKHHFHSRRPCSHEQHWPRQPLQ